MIRQFMGMLLAFVLVNQPALGASLYSGEELLALCDQPSETTGRTYCFGYVVGIAEVLDHRQEICLPAGVIPEDLMDVVVRYLEETPAIRNEPAQIPVSIALVRAFRCE